jgi:hypothetical protein
MIKAAGSSKTLLATYQAIWHPTLEDSNLYAYQRENPKFEHQHNSKTTNLVRYV